MSDPVPSSAIYDATTAGKTLLTAADEAAQRTLLSVYSTSEVDAIIGGIDGLTSADIDTLAEINAILTDADLASVSYVDSGLSGKQAALISGTNIKTVNSTSLLGSGNITVGLSGTGSVDNAALRADGTGGATLQSSSIVINDNLTASPNNTVNHACIEATGGTTNVSISLKPKGTGSFSLQAPDGTTTGGNVRGANAVDLQGIRGNANQVASGDLSFVGSGSSNKATGPSSATLGGDSGTASGQRSVTLGGVFAVASSQHAVAGGYGGQATGNTSFAFGYQCVASGQMAMTFGNYSLASGEESIAFGYRSTASAKWATSQGSDGNGNKQGQRVIANGRFAALGDAQGSELVVRRSTTNATQSELFLDGSSLRITIANDTTWAFECLIVGRRTDADNESAAYRITGCIDRNTNAASTALVGTPTVTVISEDTAAWDVDAVADTTNGSLNLRVTGEAAKTIRWVGWVRLVEVTG